MQRVEERLPAGDHRVHVEASPRLLEKVNDAVFENVAPQRDECGRSIVHDECCVLGEEAFHQRVKPALVDTAVAQQFETANVQRFVLEHRAVDRVRVDATDLPPAVAEVLCQNARNQRFADTALALQRQVNGIGVALTVVPSLPPMDACAAFSAATALLAIWV